MDFNLDEEFATYTERQLAETQKQVPPPVGAPPSRSREPVKGVFMPQLLPPPT